MKSTERVISEDDLHAYVDGFLSSDDIARVEDYLKTHREAAARVENWKHSREALRRGLAFKAQEPVPSALNVQRLAAARRARSWAPQRVAAGIVLALGIGMGVGWYAHPDGSHGLASLGQQAALAQRVLVADAGRPAEFSTTNLTQRVGWTDEKLGHQVTAPDLSAAGYKLLGSRLVPTEQGAAPMFTYENAHGDRISIFIRLMVGIDTNASMRPIDGKDVSGYAWAHDGVGFGVVSSKPIPELRQLSNQVRSQIEIGT